MEFKNSDEKFLYQSLKNKRKFNKLKKQLDKKPLAYILGNQNFYGYEFKVNKHTLIPRFETEELVEKTNKYIKQNFKEESVRTLDLCSGSGAIGITLNLLNNNIILTQSDISKKALKVTKTNAKKHHINSNIIKSNIFNNVTGVFDVIISNPPYIKEGAEIDKKVLENEPYIALFAGQDGLKYYKKIFENAKKHLAIKSFIALEIGESQKNEIEKLIKKYFKTSKYSFEKDLQGRDRMVFIFNNLN